MTQYIEVDEDQIGNDLFAKFDCVNPSCEDDQWDWQKVVKCRRVVRLSGYNDGNFFDCVNKEPRTRACKCGQEYSYQWTRDGVKVSPKETVQS